MYQVKSIILKDQNPLKYVFDEQTHLSKLFKNSCIFRLRQLFFAWKKNYDETYLSTHEKEVLDEFRKSGINITKRHSLPNYKEFDSMFKLTKNNDYYNNLPMQCTQQIIKECLSDFKSFFKSIKAYNSNPSKFKACPNIPKYKKTDKISFDITNQDAVIYEKSSNTYELKLPKTKLRLNLGELNITNLKEVTVIPFYNTYKINIVYEIEDKEIPSLDKSRILGLDLGVNNFLTTSNNVGLVPFIINGKIMKSKNQFLNKKISNLKILLSKDKFTSKRIKRLWKYRNNFFNNQIHKISTYIINYCLTNNIGVIVIGKNDSWKQNINIGKSNNQTFCFIPHASFIKKLEEKANIYGIKVIEQEESYTSKASFLDNDDIPTYEEGDTTKYNFSGKRIERGLYKTKENILINADVNGASNIIKKYNINAFKQITDFSYLTKTVERITIV